MTLKIPPSGGLVHGHGNATPQPSPDIYGFIYDGPWLGTAVGDLCPKFRDRIDPNTAMPIYSSPCHDIPIGFPTQCSQSERPVRLSKSTLNSETKIFPNPVLNDLYLKNLVIGSEYTITDLLGNVLVKNKVVEKSEKINLTCLVPGVYLINIYGSSTQKIVKQ